MAELIKISKNKYKVNGPLTDENIAFLNNQKNRTLLVVDNTSNLTSVMVNRINNERILFSVKGGLDYEQKQKYNNEHYIERTYLSSKGLTLVLRYFENIESLINPEWSDLDKAMFYYNALVEDITYEEHYPNDLDKDIACRSLNGILYGDRLVCSGIALTFKEAMDRIGIPCIYQNVKDKHSFNVITIDGKDYCVDATWDVNHKPQHNGKCGFDFFGRDSEIYNNEAHAIGHYEYEDSDGWFETEEEEKLHSKKLVVNQDEEYRELSAFSKEELTSTFGHIAQAVITRSNNIIKYDLGAHPYEERREYLPINIAKDDFLKKVRPEFNILVAYVFLKSRNKLNLPDNLKSVIKTRISFLLDVNARKITETNVLDLGISSFGTDCVIDVNGNIRNHYRFSRLNDINTTIPNHEPIPEEELNRVELELNKSIETYYTNMLKDSLSTINTLFSTYEYAPEDFDIDRVIRETDIRTKLDMIKVSRDYLVSIGFNQEYIDAVCQKIDELYSLTHQVTAIDNEKIKSKNTSYYEEVFSALDDVKTCYENYEGRTLSNEEFKERFISADYNLQVFDLLKLDESFTKEDLQSILDKLSENINTKTL